ncbi:MAG: sodium-dependent transporter [Thomasclavelia sp.]|jgi:NSS family neurotransmitter:Na+ symporter|nr:sodium-dependent transporter [Thomasclavelia sp.]
MEKNRGSFTGRLGFVLAAAGSAVGLGNLWRFPYLAAQYGGGIFILVYIILALTFGFALMVTEIAIGRKTKLSPILAYGKVDKKFSFLGYIATIVPVLILPYYSVIGGWVLKYVGVYIKGLGHAASSNTFFSGFISETAEPLVFTVVFLLLTAVIVIFGVEKGIEKASKVLMPVLVVLIIGISIYVLTLPGALEGVKYYLIPDFSKFGFKTICAAMGQLFYSMSLAMGIMITYGSYTKDKISLGKAVNQIEIFDTFIALFAGLMIIPAIYAFSGAKGLTASGAGLMFVSLPKIFGQMAGGGIIGLAFFILVLFAALTSSVSIMEAIVSCFMDKFKIKRITACLICLGTSLLLAVPSSLGYGLWESVHIIGMDFLTFFDYISNSVLMPIVAFCTVILIGWKVGTKYVVDEVVKNGETFRRQKIYEVMTKYIAPVLLVTILVFYTLMAFGIVQV